MSTTKKCNGNGIRGVLCPVSVITVKNSKEHIYSAIAAWFFKVIKQTLMRSKCKILHSVLEKFSSYGLDISTVNSEYKKIFKPSPSAE